jgi:hypothetical protein
MVMPPGSRAIGGIRLNGNGENVLKLSQLVNSKRSTTSGWRGATSCETAPPGVVADDRRALEPERPDQLGDQLRLARWREISVPVHRDDVGAHRPVGDQARQRYETLPHRKRYLLLNHQLGTRLLQAHREWLDIVERELRQPAEP